MQYAETQIECKIQFLVTLLNVISKENTLILFGHFMALWLKVMKLMELSGVHIGINLQTFNLQIQALCTQVLCLGSYLGVYKSFRTNLIMNVQARIDLRVPTKNTTSGMRGIQLYYLQNKSYVYVFYTSLLNSGLTEQVKT